MVESIKGLFMPMMQSINDFALMIRRWLGDEKIFKELKENSQKYYTSTFTLFVLFLIRLSDEPSSAYQLRGIIKDAVNDLLRNFCTDKLVELLGLCIREPVQMNYQSSAAIIVFLRRLTCGQKGEMMEARELGRRCAQLMFLTRLTVLKELEGTANESVGERLLKDEKYYKKNNFSIFGELKEIGAQALALFA